MEPFIETPRLALVRLRDTSEGSQHVQWYHQYWNDDVITSNSRHGKCHTLEESRAWMIQNLVERGSIHYAAFVKTGTSKATERNPGEMVGNVALWRPAVDAQPSLPPLKAAASETNGKTEENTSGEEIEKPFNTWWLGYALFEKFYGKGYATEAVRATLEVYRKAVAEEVAKGKERFYLEGHTDEDNYASQRIMDKLGFQRVGWLKEEKEFRKGKWMEGCWVYGMHLSRVSEEKT